MNTFSEKLVKIRAWILLALGLLISPIIIFAALTYVIFKSIYKTRKSVAGEVALITGSANGLGKEIAIALAAKGCHIAVVDINEEAATSTARLLRETYNIKAKAFKVDITQFDEVKALSKDVEDHLGPVTILVNNAGIMTFSSHLNPPPVEVQNMINTNITAHLWTVRVFCDKMKELGKGHIVGISSLAGLMGFPRNLEYITTKFAVRGFMDALRSELCTVHCEFIRTTTVYPYFLKTNSKVVDITERIGINDALYPNIPGEVAAKAIVEGILTNEIEVCIPGFITLLYRLLGLLPKDWQMMIVVKGPIGELLSKFTY